jgi:hypothetical protein
LAEVEAMPARDFERWAIYFRHRPRFDPWWAMARICLAIATAFGVRKGKAAPSVRDFYPVVERRRKRPRSLTVDQSAAAIRAALGVRRGA